MADQMVRGRVAAPMAMSFGGGFYPPRRCFRWGTGPDLLKPIPPIAGGDIDGVGMSGGHAGFLAHAGAPVEVEAADAFSAEDRLATLADGRVKSQVSGETAILRALEDASGPGATAWAVFISGR